MKPIPKLMLVTQKGNKALAPYLNFLETCIKNGVDCIQLREKNSSQADLLDFGLAIKKLLKSYDITFIVNDNIKLCLALDADGVHLGQKDENAKRARKILGADKIIGLSVENLTHIEKANLLPINYIGVGAIFPTDNKKNVETIWGLDRLITAKTLSKHPIIAIGGINETNAESVVSTRIHGIAAIGAFHDSREPKNTSQYLHQLLGDKHVR